MKKTGLALVVGTLLGALSMTDAAQAAVAQVFGAFPSHQTEEIYDLSVGATAAGNNVRSQRQREWRSTVVVPSHYGEVVAVTPAGEDVVVWYQGGDGVLRNVVLAEPDAVLYRLENREATRLQVRLVP